MTILHQISAAIRRNPKINRVIISDAEYELLIDECHNMQHIQTPRPEYIMILGRNVERAK